MAFQGIIPNVQKPSLGELLAKSSTDLVPGFAQALGASAANRQENEAIKRMIGQDVSGLSPELKKVYLQNVMGEKKEKRNLLETFTPIIDQMKSLREHVGPIASMIDKINPYSSGAGKRAQIDTLRLSLEGLFRDLTLKGQFPKAIYERILQNLPSRSDAPEEYDNKIDAIEKILHSNFGGGEGVSGGMASSGEPMGARNKQKFSPENREHRRKADQLYKKYKDKEKVREALSREFEF